MICKFCDEFWDRFWAHSDAWERSASNENELLSKESDQTWDLIQSAGAIEDSDSASAFGFYVKAAEAGSVWSMERVGWHYWSGTGVEADPSTAQEYYRRAIRGGSWIATISYARLLAELGHQEESERTLKDGVASDFTPAYFWLAWIRYLQSKTAETCREVRPLLDYAARKGHPAAQAYLARWMALGKLGLHEVPRGWLLVLRGAVKFAFRRE